MQSAWVALGITVCLGVGAASGAKAAMEDPPMTPKTQRVVRVSAGAGRWFPADKATLSRMVGEFIAKAQVPPVTGRILGAIAPHAGYVYSGSVAGYVFRAIQDQAARGMAPDTVVILGFSHRGGCRGICLMDGDAIRTPLGETPLDKEAAAFLTARSPLVVMNAAPHHGEHSAENQVPFVQTVLPKARLVLALIGDLDPATQQALVSALDDLAHTRPLLVLASSDLLHDPDYSLVTRTDRASLERVAALKTRELLSTWSYERQTFCGMAAVAATMLFAERQGCREGIVLRYRNSGDDHPDSRGQWVVGYGAVVFPAPRSPAAH